VAILAHLLSQFMAQPFPLVRFEPGLRQAGQRRSGQDDDEQKRAAKRG